MNRVSKGYGNHKSISCRTIAKPLKEIVMRKNVIQILSMFVLVVMITLSCSEEGLLDSFSEENSIETEQRRDRDNDRYTSMRPVVLGDEINNPYTVEIVNQAQQMLYSNSEPKSATHYYVKFSPNDQDDIAELLDWSHENLVVMFDYPLHYEIVEEGDYYIDTEASEEALLSQYASIPVEMPLPSSVPNEILEDLYLDETNPLIFVQTYIMTDNMDKIKSVIGDGIPYNIVEQFMPDFDVPPCPIDEIPPPPICEEECELVLTYEEIEENIFECFWFCNCPDDPPPPPPSNNCGCTIPSNAKKPAGCVQVDADNGVDPVRVVKVAVWDWNWGFKTSDIVFTDENGCWEVDREYNDFKMKVIFESQNVKVRALRYFAGLRILRDMTRSFNSLPYNNINIRYNAID